MQRIVVQLSTTPVMQYMAGQHMHTEARTTPFQAQQHATWAQSPRIDNPELFTIIFINHNYNYHDDLGSVTKSCQSLSNRTGRMLSLTQSPKSVNPQAEPSEQAEC